MNRMRPKTARLGLVVGLGAAAGIFYYRRLIDVFEKRNKALDLLMLQADLPTAFEFMRSNDIDGLCAYQSSLMDVFVRAGCDFAAISSATQHVCIDQVQSRTSIPVISLLDAVRDGLKRSKLRRICLFGTSRVIESDLFGAAAELDVVKPQSAEVQAIDALYTALALRGSYSAQEYEALDRIARTIAARERLDAIVLAGTDLSPVFEARPFSVPVFDVSQAHIESIALAIG